MVKFASKLGHKWLDMHLNWCNLHINWDIKGKVIDLSGYQRVKSTVNPHALYCYDVSFI